MNNDLSVVDSDKLFDTSLWDFTEQLGVSNSQVEFLLSSQNNLKNSAQDIKKPEENEMINIEEIFQLQQTGNSDNIFDYIAEISTVNENSFTSSQNGLNFPPSLLSHLSSHNIKLESSNSQLDTSFVNYFSDHSSSSSSYYPNHSTNGQQHHQHNTSSNQQYQQRQQQPQHNQQYQQQYLANENPFFGWGKEKSGENKGTAVENNNNKIEVRVDVSYAWSAISLYTSVGNLKSRKQLREDFYRTEYKIQTKKQRLSRFKETSAYYLSFIWRREVNKKENINIPLFQHPLTHEVDDEEKCYFEWKKRKSKTKGGQATSFFSPSSSLSSRPLLPFISSRPLSSVAMGDIAYYFKRRFYDDSDDDDDDDDNDYNDKNYHSLINLSVNSDKNNNNNNNNNDNDNNNKEENRSDSYSSYYDYLNSESDSDKELNNNIIDDKIVNDIDGDNNNEKEEELKYKEERGKMEEFSTGDIVAVLSDGTITKCTSYEETLFISVIAGEEGEKRSPWKRLPDPPPQPLHHYSLVAILGQMVVKVRGRVPPLSVIVPSGCDDGVGVAIPKSSLSSLPYSPVIALPLQTDNEDDNNEDDEKGGIGKVRLILAMRTEAVNEIWTNLLCNEMERFKSSQQNIEEIQIQHQIQLDHLHAILLHLSQFLPHSHSPSSISHEGETMGEPEDIINTRKQVEEEGKKKNDVTSPPPLSHQFSSLESLPSLTDLSLHSEEDSGLKERGGKRFNSLDSFPPRSYSPSPSSTPSSTSPSSPPSNSTASSAASLSSSSSVQQVRSLTSSMGSYPNVVSNQFQYEVIKFRPKLQSVDGRLICKEIDLLLLDSNIVMRLKEEIGTTSILEPGKSNVIYSLPLVGTNLTEPLSNTIIVDLHYKSSIFTFAFQKRSSFLPSDIDLIRSQQQCKIYVNGYAFEFIVRNKLVARLVRVQHISQHPIEELFDCDLFFRSSSRIRSKILPLSKRWIEKYQSGQPSPFNGYFASKLMKIPSQEYFLLCSYCKKRQWTDVSYFILSPNPDHYSTFESLSDVQLAAIEHSLLFEVNKILHTNDDLNGIYNKEEELTTPHDRAILLCSYYLSLTPFGPMSLEHLLIRSTALIKSFATSHQVKERLEEENVKWENVVNSFQALFIVLQTNISFFNDNNFAPLFDLLFYIAKSSEKKESFKEFRETLKAVAIEVGKKYSSTPSLSSSANYKSTVTSLSDILSFFACDVPFDEIKTS